MRKLLMSSLFAMALGIGIGHAEVVIKVRPPKVQVEHPSARPSKEHVWVGGYHRWDGNAYVWEGGKWEKPPKPHGVWVAPKYTHEKDGYRFHEGHWR